MRRRDFIKAIAGSAAFWPLTAWAQQPLPVIGFLGSASPDEYAVRLRTFRQGLQETGYVEGQNVAIEYRWAEDQNNRLPILAAELVRRRVAVIVAAGGTPSAAAAKAVTATIPIIFAVAVDPVEAGFVASLSQPNRRDQLECRGRPETARGAAPIAAHGDHYCCARRSD
jgi:putative ABC transport system substrate-binding protein